MEGKPIAIIEFVMYVRSRLNPSSVKRFFFFDTTERMIDVIEEAGVHLCRELGLEEAGGNYRNNPRGVGMNKWGGWAWWRGGGSAKKIQCRNLTAALHKDRMAV